VTRATWARIHSAVRDVRSAGNRRPFPLGAHGADPSRGVNVTIEQAAGRGGQNGEGSRVDMEPFFPGAPRVRRASPDAWSAVRRHGGRPTVPTWLTSPARAARIDQGVTEDEALAMPSLPRIFNEHAAREP
jgi:hypothetical protein